MFPPMDKPVAGDESGGGVVVTAGPLPQALNVNAMSRARAGAVTVLQIGLIDIA